MSTVKSTKDFLRTLGLSVNSKTRDHENDSSDDFSPQDIAKELFFTPEKLQSSTVAGSKRKAGLISNDDHIDLHQLFVSDNFVSDDEFLLPDKETILQKTGIDENLRSSKMVVMAPTDQDSSEFKELTAMVEGTVTPGEIIEIDPTKAIKKAARTPLAWLLALIVSFFSEYFKGNYDTKLSIGGTVQKPSPDAVPKDLPAESSDIDRWNAWQEWFRSHCYQYCPQAWQIWLQGKVIYPISPTPEELAIYMEDKGYVQDRTQFSPSELLGFLNEWVKDNLTKSTQNCNTYFYAHWCDTQLRKACSKVKILVGQIQAIPVLEIGAIKRSITNFYRELDVFKLHEYTRAFKILQIKPGQTLREFLDVLVKILTSLGRLGCRISNEEQKWVYFNSAKLIYEGKLYLTMKTLLKNNMITLARSVVVIESELQNKGIDPDFSRRYTQTNKSRRVSEPMEEILSLANNYDEFVSDTPPSSKVSKNSAMMARGDAGNLCNNKFCNLFGRATHSQKDCWEQHREKAPAHYSEFLDVVDKMKGMSKRHKNKGNGTNSMMNSKFWDKSTKQAYMTIKKRAQEMGTTVDGCPDEIVELQALFNYTGANKANKKRIKKLQKQIDKSGVDKPEFKSNGKYHKGSGFKDGK